MKDTAETIEFFTPKLGLEVTPYIQAGQKQGVHHIGRYQWACRIFEKRQPKRVLDIACGAGYGSFMMAQALPSAEITGCDYDARAVDYAKNAYSAPNLRFFQADMVTWRKGDEPLSTYDAITSFDTIEHLLHREIALLRLAENLHDDGVLLLSTPCGRSANRLNPGWEHHKIEYSFYDLYQLLSRFFAKVVPPHHPEFEESSVWQLINDGALRYVNIMNPVICLQPRRFEKPARSFFDPGDKPGK